MAALEREDGPELPGVQPAESAIPTQRARRLPRASAAAVMSSSSHSREPHAVIIATGSEVALAVEAQKLLTQKGIPVRVVSMPSTTVFDRQDAHYRDSVLPPLLPCVAVEAGASDLWHKYVGRTGAVVGIDRFGESAPAGRVVRAVRLHPRAGGAGGPLGVGLAIRGRSPGPCAAIVPQRSGTIYAEDATMKVTVCQLHNGRGTLTAEWDRLVEHVRAQRSELVLLARNAFLFLVSDAAGIRRRHLARGGEARTRTRRSGFPS